MKFTSILAGAALALGLAGAAFAQDKIKVGFIYVGPVGDGGEIPDPARKPACVSGP